MKTEIYQNILHQFEQLSFNDKLDLIADLIQTIKETKTNVNQQLSAEKKAENRLKDELESSQWITVISEEDEINEEELNNWVKNRA